MARSGKYHELVIAQSHLPKQFLHGYSIVSDHVGSDGNRHLFLKREGAEQAKPTNNNQRRSARKKSAASKSNSSPAPSPATSFNTTELEN